MSLYFAPTSATSPELIKTTKNKLIAGIMLAKIVSGFITPIINKTISTGKDDCRKQ